MQKFDKAAEQISLFCRININTRKEMPIRSSEMGMLIFLVKSDEEKTPMNVAEFFKVSKSMATNMVSSLVKRGYIKKKQSQLDKRSYTLVPTEKAIDLVENTYSEYFKTMLLLQDKMGDKDFCNFISMLEKVNNILLEDRNNG